MSTKADDGSMVLTGRHVLIGLLVAFAIVFAVNGLMIFKALSTFDGLEVTNAYQKGRAYNDVLTAMEKQKALGWKATIDVIDNGRDHEAHIVAVLMDKSGEPLRGLTVRSGFWRPVVGGMDQSLPMSETSAGHYEADFTLAAGGNWVAQISAADQIGGRFVQEERVFIHD